VVYRARTWLPGEHIPHGVFLPADAAQIEYEGEAIDLPVPDEQVISLPPLRASLAVR
jgi:hypothetical protein